jgi:hypothetical protein
MTVYSAILDSVTVTSAADLLLIKAGSRGLRILRIYATGDDEASVQQAVLAVYRASDLGTGGTDIPAHSLDPVPLSFGGLVKGQLAAAATKSPAQPLVQMGANLSEGWFWEQDEDSGEEIALAAGGIVVIRLETAVTSCNLTIDVKFSEA